MPPHCLKKNGQGRPAHVSGFGAGTLVCRFDRFFCERELAQNRQMPWNGYFTGEDRPDTKYDEFPQRLCNPARLAEERLQQPDRAKGLYQAFEAAGRAALDAAQFRSWGTAHLVGRERRGQAIRSRGVFLVRIQRCHPIAQDQPLQIRGLRKFSVPNWGSSILPLTCTAVRTANRLILMKYRLSAFGLCTSQGTCCHACGTRRYRQSRMPRKSCRRSAPRALPQSRLVS